MKITRIISVIALLSSFGSNGQARMNRASLEVIDQTTGITEATGWYYDGVRGEWIDYPNVICPMIEYKTEWTLSAGSNQMSHYSQNFISMNFKKVYINGDTSYILSVLKWAGRYKYPTIREDWQKRKDMEAYLLTSDQYNQLVNLQGTVSLDIYVAANVPYWDDSEQNRSDLLDRIQTASTREIRPYSTNYPLNVMLSEEGAIRFFVPERKSSIDLDRQFNFQTKYFETTQENWNNLIQFR